MEAVILQKSNEDNHDKRQREQLTAKLTADNDEQRWLSAESAVAQ